MYQDDYEKKNPENMGENTEEESRYPENTQNAQNGQADSQGDSTAREPENSAGSNPGSGYDAGRQGAGGSYGGYPRYGSGQEAGNAQGRGTGYGPQAGYGQGGSPYGQGTGYGPGNSSYGAGSRYGGGYGPGNGTGQPQYQHYAPWQNQQAAGQINKKPEKKGRPHPIAKKAAGITAAALLFGVVAGGTIAGINTVSGRFLASSQTSSEAAQAETSLAQAQTLPAETQGPAEAVPALHNDVSAIVERAMPSVVAINSVTEYQVQNWFGQTQSYQGKGSGSGIIVGESDSELLVVTNNHVIEGAKEIGIVFTDNEEVKANIKGTDSANDLAVIAVALDQIPEATKSKIAVATLGDSDSLKVGQGVIAIGNALGYGQSVTVGYVSALDREVKTDQQTTRNLLQTDAAINPGNSGGALLNMQGEVVGINSAKYSSTEVEGMGYAIPISKVHDIIGDLMTKKTRVEVEEAKQGYLGIQGTDIDANTSNLYDMPQGVYVYKIMEDGAAASSELKEKDIITKFDGQSVGSMAELKQMLTYYAGGDEVSVTIQTLENGQYVEREIKLTLGTRPTDGQVN